jgi:ABC-type polysaccharide/polyol phosphate export permease
MPLPVTVTLVVLIITLVAVFVGYLIHRNAERHDAKGGR